MSRNLLALIGIFFGLLINAQNIRNGQSLQQDRKYWSDNQQFYLQFQNDGNLVFYRRSGAPVWESKTANRGSSAIFQDDGNLVVYGLRNRAVFSTNTADRGGNKLTIQDDGNLVIYNNNNPLWASTSGGNNGSSGQRSGNINLGHTFRSGNKTYSPNSRYYLSFQADGNLVLSRSNGTPIWSSDTNNKGGRAEFQNDGNLVVYDSYSKAVWKSNTSNSGASRLSVQDDGNLVIYDRNNNVVWASSSQQ